MKLKKEEVYVKVTTLEESQELLKVLTESGEEMYIGTKDGLKEWNKEQQDYPNIYFIEGVWVGSSDYIESSKLITIQQLKEILQPATLESVLAELESLKGKVEGLINNGNRSQLDTDIEALKEKYKDFKITVIVE